MGIHPQNIRLSATSDVTHSLILIYCKTVILWPVRVVTDEEYSVLPPPSQNLLSADRPIWSSTLLTAADKNDEWEYVWKF